MKDDMIEKKDIDNEIVRKSDGIHREIHTFVLRQGHFTASERKAYEELHDQFCLPYSEEKLDFEKIFGNKNPVVVEIG